MQIGSTFPALHFLVFPLSAEGPRPGALLCGDAQTSNHRIRLFRLGIRRQGRHPSESLCLSLTHSLSLFAVSNGAICSLVSRRHKAVSRPHFILGHPRCLIPCVINEDCVIDCELPVEQAHLTALDLHARVFTLTSPSSLLRASLGSLRISSARAHFKGSGRGMSACSIDDKVSRFVVVVLASRPEWQMMRRAIIAQSKLDKRMPSDKQGSFIWRS